MCSAATRSRPSYNEKEVEKLHAKIGRLAMENDFFIQGARARPMSERRGRIHEKHDLSKTRRCELLDVPRSSAYYIPMAKGFMYLVAIMDWYSRRVLSWRVSNTLDTVRTSLV